MDASRYPVFFRVLEEKQTVVIDDASAYTGMGRGIICIIQPPHGRRSSLRCGLIRSSSGLSPWNMLIIRDYGLPGEDDGGALITNVMALLVGSSCSIM